MLPVDAPAPAAAPDGLFQTLLDVSLTGVIVFRPVCAPAGYDPHDPATVVDLAYVQLNPAAQRMLRLPACPADSFLTLYPSAVDTGIFAFYRDTFLSGKAGRYDVNYQHDGLDNYYQLAAQRHGELLVVSFSDTAEQPRTAVEQALRESQAREQQARAEAEAGRQRLHDILTQLPAQVAVNRGPAHVYELVNPRYQQQFPTRAILGRPVREALPELEGQGFYELLDQVYQTGEPFYGQEMPAEVDYAGSGQMELRYFNVFFQALRDAQGRVDGLLNFAYDVTPLVLARREAEQLNQELEARVFERTQALRHAQAEAVAATQRLLRITESLPSTSFTTDAAGQVLYISPQWYAYTGMAPGTDINEVWPTLIHPDDLPAIGQEFGAALAEGRPWRYEFRLRGAAGQYRWFASQGVPEPLEEAEAAGRPRQWFGANLDIDELKNAQQQLEEKDELLTSILSSIPASVATFEGEDLRFGFFNEAYQRLARGRVVPGRAAVEVFPEVAEQGFLALLRQVLRTGEPHQGQEVPAYARDPHTGQQQDMYLDLAYLPLRHGQHPPHAVLGFIVDVTDRVLARQRAEALQAELLAAAQRQVQERAAFYEISEQTTALVALVSAPGHRYEYVNPAYQALFAGRQLVGLDMADALPELRGLGFIALMDRVYQTGETYYGIDTPFTQAPDAGQPARTAYYNFTYQAYRENGQIAGISVFAYDVTEQVLAREGREAQQRELEQLFMQAPAPIVVLDGPELMFQLVNPAYQQIFPGRELVGKPLLDALPELRGTVVPDLFRQVYETGEPYTAHELPLLLARHEGDPLEEIYWDFTYQARRDAQGTIDGVRVFAHDVTEQVRTRQEREVQRQRLHDLFMQAPAAICILGGPELVFELVNPRYQALLPGRVLLGQPFPAALPELADHRVYHTFRAVYETGVTHEEQGIHVTLARPDGLMEDRYFNYIQQARRDAQGQPDGVLVFVFEVTDQVLARQQAQALAGELTTSNQQLTRTNVDLDTFIYTASHDLKAPISNIEGLLTMLRDELPAPAAAGEVPYILDLMQDSVERFKHTIGHLTDVSKLHKEYDQPASAVALAAVVEGVRLDLSPLLRQTGGHFDVDVRAVPTVTFSEKNLRSVVFNLLSNALKYRHPDRPPQVRVRARPDGAFAVLEVRDNGLGFDVGHEKQLFAMFQRLHTHVEGSGVGLYMVKRLVENAGGRIAVESTIGEGSTFTVSLPR